MRACMYSSSSSAIQGSTWDQYPSCHVLAICLTVNSIHGGQTPGHLQIWPLSLWTLVFWIPLSLFDSLTAIPEGMHKFCHLLSAIKERIKHRQAGRDLLHHHVIFYSSQCFEDLRTGVSSTHVFCWPQLEHRNFVKRKGTLPKCDWVSIHGASRQW